MKEIVGKRLLAVLKGKNINQYEAAARLDIGQPRLNNYLKGNRAIPAELLIKFCKEFDTTLDYVFGIEANDSKSQASGYPQELIIRAVKNVSDWVMKHPGLVVSSEQKGKLVVALMDKYLEVRGDYEAEKQETDKFMNIYSRIY